MKRKYLYWAGGAFGVLFLFHSCGHSDPVVYQQPAPPVQYEQQPQQPAPVIVQNHDSGPGFFSGLMMGHMMSGHHSAPVAHHTTVINKHYTTKRISNRTTYKAPKRYYGRSSVSRSRSTFRSSRRR